MKFLASCLFNFEKEWKRNREIFLILLRVEGFYSLFFQLNRHKFKPVTAAIDFTQEKYAPQLSLMHANSQIIDIYSSILFRIKEANEQMLEANQEQKSNIAYSLRIEVNRLFEDLFIRFGIVLDSMAKAILLLEKKPNTKCLWTSFAKQESDTEWRAIILDNNSFTSALYSIRSDYLHGSIHPEWVVLNRHQDNDGLHNVESSEIVFSLQYNYHSGMKKITRLLGLGDSFSFFDFLYSVIKHFLSFEDKVFESLFFYFYPKLTIKQYKELGEIIDYELLSDYEKNIISEYKTGRNGR